MIGKFLCWFGFHEVTISWVDADPEDEFRIVCGRCGKEL